MEVAVSKEPQTYAGVGRWRVAKGFYLKTSFRRLYWESGDLAVTEIGQLSAGETKIWWVQTSQKEIAPMSLTNTSDTKPLYYKFVCPKPPAT
jgi:hypothetical protein